jgi:hypothetical protein
MALASRLVDGSLCRKLTTDESIISKLDPCRPDVLQGLDPAAPRPPPEPGELAASLPFPSPQASVLVVRAIMQRWGQDEAEMHGRWNFDDTQLTQHLTSLPSALSNPPLKSGKTPSPDTRSPLFRSHRKYGPSETASLSSGAPRGRSQGRRSKQKNAQSRA